jgi:hypothetical protein
MQETQAPFRVSLVYTQDIKLAAALLTLGAKPHEDRFIERIEKEGHESCYFVFNPSSKVIGCESVQDAVRVWLNQEQWEQWEKRNPEAPLAYMRGGFHNRERLLDLVKMVRKTVAIRDKTNPSAYHMINV